MSDAVPAIGAIERLRLYYSRNEQRIAVLSFICGFLFDIVTVERADHWLAIVQQVVYIGVILAALRLERAYVYFMHEDDALGTVFARKLMELWKQRNPK